MKNIADLVRGKDIYILSDEIYERISYGVKPTSIASIEGMKDQTIILDGFQNLCHDRLAGRIWNHASHDWRKVEN